MDSFFHELQVGDSSSKDTWLLVCCCIRYFFKELRKIRSSDQAALDMSFPVECARSYIWSMDQSHLIYSDFMPHRWHEHSAVTGVINYYLFRFIVPLTLHNKLKTEITSLQMNVKDRQCELSKLTSRL